MLMEVLVITLASCDSPKPLVPNSITVFRQNNVTHSYKILTLTPEQKAYVLNQDYSVTHWMTLTSAFTDLLTSL